MAAFNVTVQHSSPLISYTTSWLDTPLGDSYASQYKTSSFHATTVAGASATFKFNGTGVWFYGAKRPGYGKYSLTVDGHSVFNGSASSSNAIFDQALGGSANMSMGEHTAVLRNEGDGSIDFDTLIFETQVGDKGQHVLQTTLDDKDAAISYQPSPSTWQVADGQQFSGGSTHYTQAHDAQAKLKFSGEAIAVYGGVNFDHGEYTVTVDGKSSKLVGAGGGVRMYHAQNLLYFTDGLKPGDHELSVQVGNGFFDLDSVVVYKPTGDKSKDDDKDDKGLHHAGNMNNLHVNANANASNDTAGNSSKPMPKTVIVGIVVASIVGFISLLLIIVFLVKQCGKRRARAKAEMQQGGDDFSPVFPIQPPVDLEKGDLTAEQKSYGQPVPAPQNKSNRFTVKSFASRWSQASFSNSPVRDVEAPPPVPTLPPVAIPAPQLNMPIPKHAEAQPPRSPLSLHHDDKMHSPDDDASVFDDYYYHHDRARTPTQMQPQPQTATLPPVAPLRPHRPPGLTLGDVGTSPNRFESVPL